MSRFWSKNISRLTPYKPGEQPEVEGLLKLNTNENPYPPSPKVLAAITSATNEKLRRYPDPNAKQLRQTIAEYYQLEIDQISVGNSSDEVLGHTFQALLKQDKPLLFPDITYGFYPVYCRLFQIDFQTIPLRQDFSLSLDDYRPPNGGIIFANPNAPTGLLLTSDKIEALLQRNRDSVVVVDEAYIDFGGYSACSLINQYDNLVVIQTLSKSRSLAGLRVGFAMGNRTLIEAIERVKNSFHPYALNALALAGAKAAIKDQTYFEQSCQKIIATRNKTTQQLSENGFTVLQSSANFLMVKHITVPAKELFEQLREQAIVTRYFDKPRLKDYLRISIGTNVEMAKLMSALDKILE